MAGMTQKELKKSYFHCGPIIKGKILELHQRFKDIKAKIYKAKILTI